MENSLIHSPAVIEIGISHGGRLVLSNELAHLTIGAGCDARPDRPPHRTAREEPLPRSSVVSDNAPLRPTSLGRRPGNEGITVDESYRIVV